MGTSSIAIRSAAQRLIGDRWILIAFVLPALLLFASFVLWPMLQAFWFSLFNWNGFGEPTRFVGVQNYVEAVNTPVFRGALASVFVLIGAALLIQVPLALVTALLVGSRFRGAAFYRLILFLPYVLAQTATGIVFTFLYDGQYGLAGRICELLGIERIFVLGSESLALP